MIPVHKEIKDLINKENYKNGNFGLWFYKFVELNDKFKTGDDDVDDYKNRYDELKKDNNVVNSLIEKKHLYQYAFCKSKDKTHNFLTFRATLKSPLVTGVGNIHPCEVGMTFDHTIGIPYIPASSIKGIVRFAHTISLADEAYERGEVCESGYFDDEADWTKVPLMFGTGKDNGRRGKIVFLDAYPEKTPELEKDIMNPHYMPYYSENEPPGDYYDPKPIKFLTVAKGTKFIFRILVEKGSDVEEEVSNALRNSLEKEGVGAKTAVGYGRFIIEDNEEPQEIIKLYEEHFITEEEKIKREIQNFIKKIEESSDQRIIDSLFRQWQDNDKINTNKEIAKTFKSKVRERKANGDYTAHYKKIAEILDISLTKDDKNTDGKVDYSDNTKDEKDELDKILKKVRKAKGDAKKINKILKDNKKFAAKIKEILDNDDL
jgi:CRISPR-associated protein Cmr6